MAASCLVFVIQGFPNFLGKILSRPVPEPKAGHEGYWMELPLHHLWRPSPAIQLVQRLLCMLLHFYYRLFVPNYNFYISSPILISEREDGRP